jgi:hypothetical protein
MILLSVAVSGCAAVQQHHGDLYFQEIVGHTPATDQEREDTQACAQKAGLGTAVHVIFGGLPMVISEKDKMKSCLEARGYQVKMKGGRRVCSARIPRRSR